MGIIYEQDDRLLKQFVSLMIRFPLIYMQRGNEKGDVRHKILGLSGVKPKGRTQF